MVVPAERAVSTAAQRVADGEAILGLGFSVIALVPAAAVAQATCGAGAVQPICSSLPAAAAAQAVWVMRPAAAVVTLLQSPAKERIFVPAAAEQRNPKAVPAAIASSCAATAVLPERATMVETEATPRFHRFPVAAAVVGAAATMVAAALVGPALQTQRQAAADRRLSSKAQRTSPCAAAFSAVTVSSCFPGRRAITRTKQTLAFFNRTPASFWPRKPSRVSSAFSASLFAGINYQNGLRRGRNRLPFQ